MATRDTAGKLTLTSAPTVNSRGVSWTEDGFDGSFNPVRDHADIFDVNEGTGERRRKHLHDVCGSFATRLIMAGVPDDRVAGVMGRGADRVSNIGKVCVDQCRTIMAIGPSIAGAMETTL